MAGPRDYELTVPAPKGLTETIQPMRQIEADGAAAGARALTAAGNDIFQAGDALSQRLERAKQQTQVAEQTTVALKTVNDLEEKYTKDPDFQNAPKNFQTDLDAALLEPLGKITDPARRAQAKLEWTRAAISAGKRVQATSWTREVDVNNAALDAQEQEVVKSASAAATEAEKLSVVGRYENAVQQQIDAGWIDNVKGGQRLKRVRAAIDTVDLQNVIRTDPARAGALLDDPAQFPNLDPLQREQWKNAAKNAADTSNGLRITNQAVWNAPGAVATTGLIVDPAHGRRIFDAGIVPIESQNNPAAISSKGALGRTQIMPKTARGVAESLGMSDVVALSDADLQKRLTDPNDPLNYRLGLTYWNQQVARYGGNVAVAASAYNGGPARADVWVRKAVEQFGPGFTPAQYQQVIDVAETREYVGKLYKQLGADPNGGGLSVDARYRTASAVGTRLNSEDAESRRQTIAIATAAADSYDPTAVLKIGNVPEGAAAAIWLEQQKQAALAGDHAAAKRVRDFNFSAAMQPVVRQSYATPPAQLDQVISTEEARQASNPISSDDKQRLDVLKAVRSEVAARAHSEPVRLLARAGLATPVAVDPQADPADQNFRAALAQRSGQAIAAQRLYQGSANALYAEETRALKDRYSNAGADERLAMLQAFGATLTGRAYTDTVEAVAGKSSIVDTVGRFAQSRPELAREILAGASLLETEGVKNKAADVRGALASKLGGQVFVGSSDQDSAVEAALALYTSRRSRNGQLYEASDTAEIEKALEDITGKIEKRGGAKVPVPPGMAASAFHRTLDNISARDLMTFGGAADRSGQTMDAKAISERGILKPLTVGGSLYVVGMPDPSQRDGFAPVFTLSEAGRPLVIDMRILAGQVAPPPLTPYQAGQTQFRGGQADRLNAARAGQEP